MLEIVEAKKRKEDFSKIKGLAFKRHLKNIMDNPEANNDDVVITPPRELISNLDSLPFPARDFFDNEAYKRYYKRKFGYTTTSIMSSRGCPFSCDFCSKPVFGNVFRARSARNVAYEIEDVLSYGYDRVFFQDDCFTLDQQRVNEICNEIIRRKLKLNWECLSRVDNVDYGESSKMKEAGCSRIFFGIESGNNEVLQNIIKKQFTAEQAKKAVETAASAGIKTGAFFILGYPGETNETILQTIHFASSLPLDYLSFTLPYPIPGTGLYRRVEKNLKSLDPGELHHLLMDHTLNFRSEFSESKLKFGMAKATIQYEAQKHMKKLSTSMFLEFFDVLTDLIFKAMR
jgi:anaerobic magnesium-protoporphyrin IX monomethyl ester cyclase